MKALIKTEIMSEAFQHRRRTKSSRASWKKKHGHDLIDRLKAKSLTVDITPRDDEIVFHTAHGTT